MAAILFYTSIKTRVKDQESLMAEFVKNGNSVYFVNQQPNPYLPDICKNAGVHYETITYKGPRSTVLFLLFHISKLIRFAFKHKISVVYSHLEPANFVAVLAQYFLRARVIIVRHHLDLAQKMGFDKDFSYRLTYSLAREVIAVSEAAKKYMATVENVDASKIHHIDLGYDFKVFGTPNKLNVERIRGLHANKILLVSVGRFDHYKRMHLSIEVCRELLHRSVECHLLLLGAGEDERKLKDKVEANNLSSHVSFLGYVDNVLEYLSAADWLLHPSVSESSCVVIKEAGLVNLPVIACKKVGDFDEYLVHKQNALLVSADDFVGESVSAIIKHSQSPEEKSQLGMELNKVIRLRFDIRNVIKQYEQFHS